MSERDAAVEAAPRLPFPPVVLGMAGCSCSGKSTLAIELARQLNGTHFPMDHYYRDLAHLPEAERLQQNFDDPELIERPLLAAQVAALARGEAIERQVFDFSRHMRVPGRTETIEPRAVLIVEGLFALYYPELQPFYHLRIYIHAPDAVCFERRLRRDMEERGRTEERVRRQYEAAVRPASVKYVQPSAAHADLILNGTSELGWNVERVTAELRRRGLRAEN